MSAGTVRRAGTEAEEEEIVLSVIWIGNLTKGRIDLIIRIRNRRQSAVFRICAETKMEKRKTTYDVCCWERKQKIDFV